MPMSSRRSAQLDDATRLDEARLTRPLTVLDIYSEEHTPVAASEAQHLARLGEWAAANERTNPTPSQMTPAGHYYNPAHVAGPRHPSQPPPAPPQRRPTHNMYPPPAGSGRGMYPPPAPSRTTGRSVVPAALARSSIVSKADALLPEMAHDPHYYPGLIPSAEERARTAAAEESAFKKPLPRWLWHVAGGAVLFLAGLAVATYRDGQQVTTSVSSVQTAPDTTQTAEESPAGTAEESPAEPAANAEGAEPSATAVEASADATQANPEPALSARELAKQRRAERRAARLARRSGSRGSGKSWSSHATSGFSSGFGGTSSGFGATKAAPATKAHAAAGGGKTGTLQINSRPWADIYIDGKLVGHTPQMGLTLSAGKHSIKLTNPSMGLTKKLSVTIRPGETVKKIETLGG